MPFIRTYLRSTLILSIFISIIAILYWPRTFVYSLTAETEYAEIVIHGARGTSVDLSMITLENCGVTKSPSYKDVTLNISKGTKITAVREGKGLLNLTLTNSREADSVAEIDTRNGAPLPLKSGTQLCIRGRDKGEVSEKNTDPHVVLSFEGTLIVGQEARPLIRSVLLKGTVAIIEHQPQIGERYILQRSELELGDRISWEAQASDVESISGVLYVGEDQGMLISARGVADFVEVRHYPNWMYKIKPSIWGRLVNDPLLICSFLIIGLVISLLGTTAKSRERNT